MPSFYITDYLHLTSAKVLAEATLELTGKDAVPPGVYRSMLEYLARMDCHRQPKDLAKEFVDTFGDAAKTRIAVFKPTCCLCLTADTDIVQLFFFGANTKICVRCARLVYLKGMGEPLEVKLEVNETLKSMSVMEDGTMLYHSKDGHREFGKEPKSSLLLIANREPTPDEVLSKLQTDRPFDFYFCRDQEGLWMGCYVATDTGKAIIWYLRPGGHYFLERHKNGVE